MDMVDHQIPMISPSKMHEPTECGCSSGANAHPAMCLSSSRSTGGCREQNSRLLVLVADPCGPLALELPTCHLRTIQPFLKNGANNISASKHTAATSIVRRVGRQLVPFPPQKYSQRSSFLRRRRSFSLPASDRHTRSHLTTFPCFRDLHDQ